MDSEERLFWVLLTIFGALFATGPFIIFQSLWWGMFYLLTGLVGLIMLIRDRLRLSKERAQGIVRGVHVRTSLTYAAAIGISILVGQMVHTVFSLKSDISMYLMPRSVTAEQSDRLKEYLSKRAAHAISVEVVPNDQEAMGYAGQLFMALRQTNWDIDPPNHGGPAFIHVPHLPKPKLSDLGNDGKPLYRDTSEYLQAHDEWLESEIDRSVTERTYPDIGLSIQVELVGQPINPDPKNPAPDEILRAAMQYAGIEVGGGGTYNKDRYSVSLRVGHRPLQLGINFRQLLFMKLGSRISEFGQ